MLLESSSHLINSPVFAEVDRTDIAGSCSCMKRAVSGLVGSLGQASAIRKPKNSPFLGIPKNCARALDCCIEYNSSAAENQC